MDFHFHGIKQENPEYHNNKMLIQILMIIAILIVMLFLIAFKLNYSHKQDKKGINNDETCEISSADTLL